MSPPRILVQQAVVGHRPKAWQDLAAQLRADLPGWEVDLWKQGADLTAYRTDDVVALLAMDGAADDVVRLPRLRYFQAATTGVEHLPIAELAAAGVQVSNAAGTAATEIAEFVLARLLEDVKQLPALATAQGDRRWRQLYGEGLAGSDVVLVGFGAINQAVARLLAAFGAKVRVVRRTPSETPAPGVLEELADHRLADLLPGARHVVCSVPETARTRGWFDAEMLALIGDGALLVNVGRGSLLDEAALRRECASGRIRAAVDVFAVEPLPPVSELWATPGLRISGHCASVPSRALDHVASMFRENLTRLLAGDHLINQVAGPVGLSKE